MPAASCKAQLPRAESATYNRHMPIYEYECRKCKAHVEAFQKVNDKPLTKCRKCGGKLERQISAPAIQFKGTGWYVTDYAGKTTKSEKSESESVSESKSDKSGKSEKKSTDSSPAKKTSDKPSSSKA
jgi:putative FmdB family regulatory protein